MSSGPQTASRVVEPLLAHGAQALVEGEVFVAWAHNPPSEHIVFYRVYRRVGTGVWRQLAAVTEQATDVNFPGKVAMLDFEGNFPGGSDFGPNGERTYVVTAISRAGLEGPVSGQVVGTPP